MIYKRPQGRVALLDRVPQLRCGSAWPPRDNQCELDDCLLRRKNNGRHPVAGMAPNWPSRSPFV